MHSFQAVVIIYVQQTPRPSDSSLLESDKLYDGRSTVALAQYCVHALPVLAIHYTEWLCSLSESFVVIRSTAHTLAVCVCRVWIGHATGSGGSPSLCVTMPVI